MNTIIVLVCKDFCTFRALTAGCHQDSRRDDGVTIMGLFDIFRRKKEENTEEKRREFLLTKGRICEGRIIDTETLPTGEEIAYYFYEIQGVDFESSDILTDEQKNNPVKYAPGAKIGVRFDPRNHGNSILD